MRAPEFSVQASFLRLLAATPTSFWLSMLVLVVGVTWIQFLPDTVVKFLNSETGPFEQSSVAFLAAATLLALASWWQQRAAPWLAAAVVLFYAVLRELDFQKMFTYRSVMSLGYFTRPIAPLPEKLLVLLAMLPCLVAIAFLLRHLRRLLRANGVLAASPSRLSMALWVVVMFVVSHLSDRTLWFRLEGHVEAWVECVLALVVLLLVIEIKPTLLREPPGCGSG